MRHPSRVRGDASAPSVVLSGDDVEFVKRRGNHGGGMVYDGDDVRSQDMVDVCSQDLLDAVGVAGTRL